MTSENNFQKKLTHLQNLILDLDRFVTLEMQERKNLMIEKTKAEERVKLASLKVDQIIQALELIKQSQEAQDEVKVA